jgi:flagellar assembly factor FliW
MVIHTAVLGPVEVGPESFLTFPDGLVGYEAQREYALVASAEYAPFRWLLGFAEPGVSFPLLESASYVPGYAPVVSTADRRALGALEGDPVRLYVVASLSDDGQLSVNLRAPVAVNPARRLARQIVLADARWKVDHPLAAPLPAPAAGPSQAGQTASTR